MRVTIFSTGREIPPCFDFYVVTCYYSSHLFLCALVYLHGTQSHKVYYYYRDLINNCLLIFLLFAVTQSPLPTVNIVAIAVSAALVVVIALVCVLVLLLIFVKRQRNSQSKSFLVKPIPVRANRYVSADSTVTLEVDGMDKRESIVEEVELTDKDNQESHI